MLEDLKEAIKGLVERQDEINHNVVDNINRHNDGIKLLCDNMIDVMTELEKQNEAIRELQKIVYGKSES